MEKVTLGSTQLAVTSLGLGGIPLTRLTFDEAVELVKAAIAAGINFIDTAHGYPDSEPRIGAAIAAADRSSLIIATKSPATSAEAFSKQVHESLGRLGTDYIDLVQFHNISDSDKFDQVMAPGGAYEAAMELRSQGLVRHVGVTSHSVDLSRRLVASGKFETLQIPLNFLADDAASLIDPCQQAAVGFIAMKPFAGGMIDDATLATAYLRQFPTVAAIPGIETQAELQQLLALYNRPASDLSPAQKEQIAQLRRTVGSVFCRACGYCQPCPESIPIAMVLRAESFARRMPLEMTKRALDRNMKRVDDCLECGQCLPRCPYKLDIPQLLRRNRDWYTQWRDQQKA